MKNLSFINRNGLKISASLHISSNPQSKVFAIFAHCFTCGKNSHAARNIAIQLAASGINILRFDFTGIGKSEGEVNDAYFTSNIYDIIDAAEFLKQNYHTPSLLIGHSLGGTATIAAAMQLPDIKAVATIGAPANSGHVLKTMGANRDIIDQHGQHVLDFYGNILTINQQFVDDVCEKHLKDHLSASNKALLIMHSPIDQIVSIDNAGKLFQMAQHPKSFISLDKADHLLSNPKDAHYAADIIVKWASQYVILPNAVHFPKPVTDATVASLDIADTYLTRISMGKHQLLSDEPTSLGGTDLGATPAQLLAAALAACTNITLSMYSARKKWPLSHVESKVTREIIDGKPVYIRAISLQGDLTDEQTQRILEIADKCPIHKLISHETEVRSHLV